MPRYNKKITRTMKYDELKNAIKDLPEDKQALLTLLFFAGCRISEALSLTDQDINCTHDTIFIQFFRLKGSKQTDPQEIPKADSLIWLCEQRGNIFHFSRQTAWRTVKKIFKDLYPHYFRLNRITKTVSDFGDAEAYHLFGITALTIDHYRGKVDVKRVGKALQEEISS